MTTTTRPSARDQHEDREQARIGLEERRRERRFTGDITGTVTIDYEGGTLIHYTMECRHTATGMTTMGPRPLIPPTMAIGMLRQRHLEGNGRCKCIEDVPDLPKDGAT